MCQGLPQQESTKEKQMSIYKYASNATAIAEEFRNEMMQDKYDKFWPNHLDEAFEIAVRLPKNIKQAAEKFVSLTPANQLKLLSKHADHEQFWILANASAIAFQASDLLTRVDIDLHPQGSYREMIGNCHQLLNETVLRYDLVFQSLPFEDDEKY